MVPDRQALWSDEPWSFNRKSGGSAGAWIPEGLHLLESGSSTTSLTCTRAPWGPDHPTPQASAVQAPHLKSKEAVRTNPNICISQMHFPSSISQTFPKPHQ